MCAASMRAGRGRRALRCDALRWRPLLALLSALLAASPVSTAEAAGFTVVWPGSDFKTVVEVCKARREAPRRPALRSALASPRRAGATCAVCPDGSGAVLSRPPQRGIGYTSCPASTMCPSTVGFRPRAGACGSSRSAAGPSPSTDGEGGLVRRLQSHAREEHQHDCGRRHGRTRLGAREPSRAGLCRAGTALFSARRRPGPLGGHTSQVSARPLPPGAQRVAHASVFADSSRLNCCRNGRAGDGQGAGGCIAVGEGAQLTIRNSRIEGCHSANDGGALGISAGAR